MALCVLMAGALSAELWRIIGERQELVAMADAAAIAGAAAIDLERYRATGGVVIESEEATVRALAAIAGSSGGSDLERLPMIWVAPDLASVRVELVRTVPFGLLRLLGLGDHEFTVTARAIAYPHSP